jgi:hypothetical protein
MDEFLQHNYVSGLTNMAKKISYPIAVRRYVVDGEPDRESSRSAERVPKRACGRRPRA